MSKTKKIQKFREEFNYRVIKCCENCRYMFSSSWEDFYCTLNDESKVSSITCCDKWDDRFAGFNE